MEADNDIAECFAEAPGNHWLAKAVFVAGTSCITPSFPDFGLDKSPPELRLFNYRECAPIPMGVNLQDGPCGTRELSSPEGLAKNSASTEQIPSLHSRLVRTRQRCRESKLGRSECLSWLYSLLSLCTTFPRARACSVSDLLLNTFDGVV